LGGHDPILSIMEKLAIRSGDTEAVVRIMSEDLSSADRYLRIAQVYREAGQADRTLEWIERGASVFPANRSVMDVLIGEYRQRGRYHDVLRIVWCEFKNTPSMHAYEKLKEAAKQLGEWPDWRDSALNHLSDLLKASKEPSSQWYYRERSSLFVEIHLSESDPVVVLQQARQDGCSDKLWQQIADQIESIRPQDAIDIYRHQIEELVEETHNDAYSAAVRLLRKLSALMSRNERADEFEDYVGSLRKTYYRKRNFVKMLDSARW